MVDVHALINDVALSRKLLIDKRSHVAIDHQIIMKDDMCEMEKR